MLTSDVIRQYVKRQIPLALAGLLALVSIGFMIATVLLALLEVMPPAFATLSTALITLLFAGILMFVNRSRRNRRRRQSPPGSVLDGLLPIMQQAVGRNPLATAAAATVLGAVTEILMKSSTPRKPGD